MERRALGMSLALHGIILILMLCNFSFSREYSKPPVAVMRIDLNKVQISSQTNLPQKSAAKKTQVKTKTAPKKEIKEIKKISKPVKKIEAPTVKPKETLLSKNAAAVKSNLPPKKEIKSESNTKTKSKETDDLKSLLASVDKIRQAPQKKQSEENSQTQTEGIQGGLEGRLDQLMTISDKDFISSKLRECWNVDGGTDRLDEIIVEVHLSVNKEGDLIYAKYTNHMNIPAFTQVAESAVRAVRICAQKGSESPFKILAQKYRDHYSDWKEMSLRFSPTEGIY